jgi:hypothetical protein
MPALEDRLAALGDHINDELDATASRTGERRRWSSGLLALAAAAVVVLGGVGIAAVTLTDRDGRPATDTAPATSLPPSNQSTLAPTSAPPIPPPPTSTASPSTSPAVDTAPLAGELRKGSTGADVERLQRRLIELGFQPGPVDGQFGDLTEMAVWAYQKLVDGVPYGDADGVITAQLWADMQNASPVAPRRPGIGRHIEIDLPSQTLALFDQDRPVFITHISSGALAPGGDFTTGKEWCEQVTIDPGEAGNAGSSPATVGVCAVSWTPGGVYSVYRKVEGARNTRLGGMLDPIFFNYGIAFHGAYAVPLEPATHGAVRIPNQLAAKLFPLVSIGDPVYLFDGVAEPETYGAQTPPLDRALPPS